MIRIRRDSEFAARVRAFKVVLDGDIIGEIKNGQQLELDVPPGRHQLHLKMGCCRSNTVDFETNGNRIEFECGSNLRGFKIVLSIIYATLLRSRYIWLKKR